MTGKAWTTEAWWRAIATAVATIVAKILPLLALILGAQHLQAIQQVADQLSLVILALGSLVIAISGLIEAAYHFALPPPSAPAAPVPVAPAPKKGD